MKQIIVASCMLLILSACMGPRDGAAVTPVPPYTASPRPPVAASPPPATPTPELQTSAFDRSPAPTATPELPISCRNATQDTLLHISRDANYCHRYPARFSIHYPDNPENHTTYVIGPFLNSDGPEPPQADLWISSSPSAAGQTLTQAVDAIIWRDMAGITDTQRPIDPTLIASAPFTRTITTIGGEPAEIVDGLSGRMSTRQAFIIHKDQLFTLGVSPNPDFEPLFVEVQPDAKAIWETVIATFAFLK